MDPGVPLLLLIWAAHSLVAMLLCNWQAQEAHQPLVGSFGVDLHVTQVVWRYR